MFILRSTIILIFLISLSGCSKSIKFSYDYYEPKTSVSNANSGLQLGVSQIDITPPPGYPMGGFGLAGKFSRGVWLPLQAKSFYILDENGRSLVIVTCDLWSIPLGLTMSIVDALNQENPKYHIGTEQLLLTATHTHHSHSSFHSSVAYNALSAPSIGFDQELFDWMTQRIVSSIKQAVDNRTKVNIYKSTASIEGLIRNRSYEAFELNDASIKREIQRHVKNPQQYFKNVNLPPYVNQEEEFSAVDPYVTTFQFTPVQGNNQEPIGVLNFLSLHPTIMGTGNEFYSTDVFGIVNRELGKLSKWNNTIVGCINGTEGDISANWEKQNYQNTVNIGIKMAREIHNGFVNKKQLNTKQNNGVKIYSDIIPIRNQQVAINNLAGTIPNCYKTLDKVTAENPYPGVATVGGAEDGRTLLYYHGWTEGVKNNTCSSDGHADKYGVVSKFLGEEIIIKKTLESIAKNLIKKNAPSVIPIGVYQIGDLTIVGAPGELTTSLGHNIRDEVYKTLKLSTYHDVLIAGLSNEYLSYFTTPAEYSAQHYEGASSMYGFLAGEFLAQEINRLPTKGKYEHKSSYKFNAGSSIAFNRKENLSNEDWNLYERTNSYTEDNSKKIHFSAIPIFQFNDDNYQIDQDLKKAKDIYPTVSIFKQSPGSRQFKLLESDDTSLKIIKILSKAKGGIEWSILWRIEENDIQSGKYQFVVKRPGAEDQIKSKPFDLEQIQNGIESNIIK